MELYARDTPIFSFPDDNFSKYQRIFTKLGMCIGIVEICFAIANGLISSVLTELYARNTVFYFKDNNLGKYRCIFSKFDMCIDIM